MKLKYNKNKLLPFYIKNKKLLHIYILIFIIILIFSLSITIYLYNKYKHKIENFENETKPKIWCYWETMNGKTKPAYIDLCYDTLTHNCKNCFDIILLNENKIKKYLPNIDEEIDLSQLSIPHKTDYYRYALLEKYGGIWIDADIVVTRCLCPLYKQLLKSNKDYMGFGCGRDRKSCSLNPDGKYNPTNWLMMSKPKSEFMNCVKNNAQNVIEKEGNNFSYHKIGKVGLEKCITQMKSNDASWDYIHIPSTCQEYDNEGNKLNNIMKPYNIKDCSEKRYFFPLYNTAPGYPEWFKNLSKNDLLNEHNPEGSDKFYLKDILNEAFSKKNKCKM